jgi:hypothetical protein
MHMMASVFTSFTGKLMLVLCMLIIIQGCSDQKKIYQSQCNNDKTVKKVSFAHLLDSLKFYNNQYVEVSGIFKQVKGLSSLYDPNSSADQSNGNALSIDFTPTCPLYLVGKHIGFFDYDNNGGKLTPVNNAVVTMRGIINTHDKGNKKTYKAGIENVSYIKL